MWTSFICLFICLLFACCVHSMEVKNPDIIPWSLWGQMEMAKWNKCRLHSERQELSLMSSLKGQAEWPSFQSQGRLRSDLPSITKLAGSQTGWRESSVLNQTPACLWQICPHRPFSEWNTAESRTNTSLKGPVFHLIEFKLSV
jgi:hypothetical protein